MPVLQALATIVTMIVLYLVGLLPRSVQTAFIGGLAKELDMKLMLEYQATTEALVSHGLLTNDDIEKYGCLSRAIQSRYQKVTTQ